MGDNYFYQNTKLLWKGYVQIFLWCDYCIKRKTGLNYNLKEISFKSKGGLLGQTIAFKWSIHRNKLNLQSQSHRTRCLKIYPNLFPTKEKSLSRLHLRDVLWFLYSWIILYMNLLKMPLANSLKFHLRIQCFLSIPPLPRPVTPKMQKHSCLSTSYPLFQLLLF